jgi:hypothetical protein
MTELQAFNAVAEQTVLTMMPRSNQAQPRTALTASTITAMGKLIVPTARAQVLLLVVMVMEASAYRTVTAVAGLTVI